MPRRRQRLRPASAAAAGGSARKGRAALGESRRGRRSQRASAARAARRAGRCRGSSGPTTPSAALTIPSHMAGATAGKRQQVCRKPRERDGSEVVREQGRGRDRGRDRDGDALAEPVHHRPPRTGRRPPRGARASSSAIRRSRAASGRPATRMPATATNDSCQPGSPQARGFRASVTAAASSSAYQRDDGRESVIAAIPAAPITPARCSDGPAPASGTYSATRHSSASPAARGPSPAATSIGSASAISSITFCPLTASR